MDKYKMGRFLAELRRERGMTQEELGERLGVTGKTISRWECGTYMPDLNMLEAMSKLFSASVDEIIAGERRLTNNAETTAENTPGSERQTAFSTAERMEYFKRKWLHDHIFDIAVHAFMALAAVLFYAEFIDAATSFVAAAVAALAVYAIDRNGMMSYAEARAFREDGNDEKK